jgi:hypothetical protein
MANPSFPMAGNWDPTDFKKIFPAQEQSFYGSPQTAQNRIFEIYEKYKTSPQEDLSKLSENERILARYTGFNPAQAAMSAELQRINAEDASRLSRENIDYAVSQQGKYDKERDERRFKYGMLANLAQLPGQIFSQNAAYKLLGSEMGAKSLASVYGTPTPNFVTAAFPVQKIL